MKRSDILKALSHYLLLYGSGDADGILQTLEDEGMSPPGYPSPVLDAEGEMIYEWEPEDE